MRLPRFYDPQSFAPNTSTELGNAAVQHIVKALRLKKDDKIALFNGDGLLYHATLTQVEKRTAIAYVTHVEKPDNESPLNVTIGQSLSRGERMDYAVQKSTELGATQITPLFSSRCEVKLPPDRQEKRVNHWQHVAISACEQSGRCFVPKIASPLTLEAWLKEQTADLKFVLHHHAEQPLASHPTPQSVALLIGPEGGLTEEEVSLAIAHGFQPLTMGPRVLRTETAPVAALSLLNYLWGDWQ
ncbi:MAG: 16S rRNA (uracil(1498)-N(3))-methyltransferase [Pontibacterium sp.]